MFILSTMACVSPRKILLQQITQSNLKFHCKIHERMRGPEAGEVEYFHDTTFRTQQPKHVFL